MKEKISNRSLTSVYLEIIRAYPLRRKFFWKRFLKNSEQGKPTPVCSSSHDNLTASTYRKALRRLCKNKKRHSSRSTSRFRFRFWPSSPNFPIYLLNSTHSPNLNLNLSSPSSRRSGSNNLRSRINSPSIFRRQCTSIQP